MRAALALLLLATPALASSGDAGEKCGQTVHGAGLARIAQGGEVGIGVNPFGSASHGVADIGVASGGEGIDRMACIVEKSTGAAELTAPFRPAQR